MTMRRNTWKTIFRCFQFFFYCMFFTGILPQLLQGPTEHFVSLVTFFAFGFIFLSLFPILLVPRQISWDDNEFRIEGVFPHGGTYRWEDLIAYSADWGWWFVIQTWYIRFEGFGTYQIVPIGYERQKWMKFIRMLKAQFPEKETWIWLGFWPIRLGKR